MTTAIANREYAVEVFLDLKKVFDTDNDFDNDLLLTNYNKKRKGEQVSIRLNKQIGTIVVYRIEQNRIKLYCPLYVHK